MKKIKQLIALANQLDSIGLYNEATSVDEIIKFAIEDWEYFGYKSPKEYEEQRKIKHPELFKTPVKAPSFMPEEPTGSGRQEEPDISSNKIVKEAAAIVKEIIRLGGGMIKIQRSMLRYNIFTGGLSPEVLTNLDFDKLKSDHYSKTLYEPGVGVFDIDVNISPNSSKISIETEYSYDMDEFDNELKKEED